MTGQVFEPHDASTPRSIVAAFTCKDIIFPTMSSTGGGWAQLRQQARTLEQQVGAIHCHDGLSRLSLRWSPANDAMVDRDAISYILAVWSDAEHSCETLRRGAASRD